jgi:hypothetical protein
MINSNRIQKYTFRTVRLLSYSGLLGLLLLIGQIVAAYSYTESAKLQASDREAGDQFGESVAINGSRAIVGAPSEDSGGDHAGAAYIFKRNGADTWSQVARLHASDATAADYFGYAVDISGNRAIVGAPFHEGGWSGAGAAYFFERDGNGIWHEVSKVQASDKGSGDNLGWSVAIDGEWAAIAAYKEDNSGGSESGAVYLFRRQLNGSWVEVDKLKSSDSQSRDFFGHAVDISNDRLIVGALLEDASGNNAGSAYIFERDSDDVWHEVAKILGSEVDDFGRFARSVSISGSYAIVGAECDDTNGSCAGAAYMYERDGNGAWNEVAKVLASDGEESDLFGWNVAISGDRAVIGAFQEDTGGHDAGAAYIFERDNSGNWLEVTKVQAADNEAKDLFGFAVDMSDGRAIISARHDDNAAGAAYIFSDTDASCVAPPTGLISWWSGDGHANDITSSNHGTLHGHATFAPGMVEQALSLDGYGDFVSIPFNSNYDFAPHEQFTIDAWVKPEPRRSNQAILVKAPVYSDAWDWGLYVDSRNHFMAGLHFQHVLRSTTVVQSGTWYHVAVTYDNASWKLYVNGVLEAEHVGTPITQSTGALAMGRKGESAFHNDFFQGLIDEVELFDRALTADDIQEIYNAGAAGKCKDSENGAMYWADSRSGKIFRANLDGTGVADVLANISPYGIAVDTAAGKVYWTERGDPDKIRRANLDGSQIEDLIVDDALDWPFHIELDVSNGKMYWTCFYCQTIRRANLDGSNIEDLVIEPQIGILGLALDVDNGKMYWAGHRANLDGTGVESLPFRGRGIALDLTNETLYWARGNRIFRTDLDGAHAEGLVTGLVSAVDISLDVAGGQMYWVDTRTRKVQRADLDGNNVQDLVSGGLPTAVVITVP